MSKTQNSKPRTKLVHAGREPAAQFGAVNPPVYHASTILFETVAEMDTASGRTYGGPYYGRRGTPPSSNCKKPLPNWKAPIIA